MTRGNAFVYKYFEYENPKIYQNLLTCPFYQFKRRIVVIDYKVIKIQWLQLPYATDYHDFRLFNIYHQTISVIPIAYVIQTRLKFTLNLINAVTTCVNNCVISKKNDQAAICSKIRNIIDK